MDRNVTTASYWTCHNTVNEWRRSTDVQTSPWYTAQYPVGVTAVCWGSSFGSKQWGSHQCFPSLTNTRRKVSIHQSQKAKVVSTASALKEVDTTALWRREASSGDDAIHIKRYKNDMMKQKNVYWCVFILSGKQTWWYGFTKELLVYGTKKSSSEFIIVARNKYISINGGSVDLVWKSVTPLFYPVDTIFWSNGIGLKIRLL